MKAYPTAICHSERSEESKILTIPHMTLAGTIHLLPPLPSWKRAGVRVKTPNTQNQAPRTSDSPAANHPNTPTHIPCTLSLSKGRRVKAYPTATCHSERSEESKILAIPDMTLAGTIHLLPPLPSWERAGVRVKTPNTQNQAPRTSDPPRPATPTRPTTSRSP